VTPRLADLKRTGNGMVNLWLGLQRNPARNTASPKDMPAPFSYRLEGGKRFRRSERMWWAARDSNPARRIKSPVLYLMS
jgi:hypothetical protein